MLLRCHIPSKGPNSRLTGAARSGPNKVTRTLAVALSLSQGTRPRLVR